MFLNIPFVLIVFLKTLFSVAFFHKIKIDYLPNDYCKRSEETGIGFTIKSIKNQGYSQTAENYTKRNDARHRRDFSSTHHFNLLSSKISNCSNSIRSEYQHPGRVVS